MQRKMKLKWFGGNSEVNQHLSYAEMSSGSGFTMLSLSQGVQVGMYGEKRELSFERVRGCSTCEEVCLALAETQRIAPAVVDCFGLAFDNSQDGRYTWLAPGELPDLGEKKLCFRMRFVPVKEKCRDILSQYSACLQYLFYQVKYDYVHGDLKYLKGQEKDKDSRGVGAFVILIMMRISAQNTGTEENVENFFRIISLKDFFPPALTRNFIDKRFLEGSIRNKLKDYQDKHPSDSYPADILMRSFLEHILQSDKDFYEESYSAYQLDLKNIQVQESDTSGHTRYTNELKMKSSSAVSLAINLNGDSSKLKIISGKPSCEIFLQKIYEVKLQQLTFEGMDWFEVQIIAQAQYQKVYFKDRLESHSFVTCLEKYCLLMFNYYTSLCPDLQSPRIHKQYQVRAHGPVSEATIRKKLSQRGLQCRDWYVLRSNLQKFGKYDVLYLRTPKDKSLIVKSFGKVMEREDGLVLEGSQADPVPPKLFFRQQAKALGFLPSNVIPVQPQSEGCDIVQNLLTKHAITLPNAIDLETEEEKRRIASQPKVYMAGQVNIAAKIGEGHFTEVYKGRLCEQQHVVIKQLRSDPTLQRHHKQLHESLMSGFEVLLKLNGSNLFVNFLGLTLGPSTGLLMSGTGLYSMKAFLRMDRTGPPQLTFLHLIDVSIHLAEALQYMEQKNCFHGNLTCENLVVEKFDHRVLEIKVTDPGLVCFYQQLPLDHEVNIKRLPWLDPSMYKPGGLKEVTAKTEVWALGSTLWQMFEGGASPWEAINSMGGPRSIEAVQQFFLVNKKVPRCPKLLKPQADDSEPVQKYKQEFYMKLQDCWTLDSEERPCPEALLRTFISCFQEHSREYHEYSQPIYSVGSSGLSSMDSATTEFYFLNSGYTGTSKPIPNLSCLNSSDIFSDQGVLPLEVDLSKHTTDHPTPPIPRAQGVAVKTPYPLHGEPSAEVHGAGVNLPSFVILNRRLSIDKSKQLGSGYYGAVYKATLDRDDNTPLSVAVKVLKQDKFELFKLDFKKEAEVMEKLEHENIVKFYGTCDSIHGFCLVMDCLDQSLYKFLKSRENLKKEEIYKLALDVAKGMEYLEQKKILHCDLAARNILLTTNQQAKVCDFGLSKILMEDKDYYRRQTERIIPIYWSAPEWTDSRRVSSKSDVWSYGVVLWEMFSYGNDPKMNIDNPSDFVGKLIKGDRLQRPRNCPDHFYQFMRQCWDKDPERRPTFTMCRNRLDEQLSSNVQVDDKNCLGKGDFGAVYKHQWCGQEVALKICTSPPDNARFKREFTLLEKLKNRSPDNNGHPNIVMFIGHKELDDPHVKFAYMMELMKNGCLSDYLKEPKMLYDSKMKCLIDIAQGMEFLYDNIIIHCDLTARNVLLTSDLTAKVADFGWAKELENDCENSTYRRTDSQFKLHVLWAPPEVRGGTYCRQSDIWSFGVVCLEVFLDGGTPRFTKPSQPSPYSDPQEEHWARLAQNERFPKPLTCPDEVYEIIKLCWQSDPQQRIPFRDIVKELIRIRAS
ncbi:uncharacterized protein LOC128228428 isoform X1 [Mya arenaria]|uniref:uncharacterized protein LOC128228428 isoform X1 n=1 Tax=Mya arenaria TaxID=6604 RepID=UPI0022E551DC|nr:uncharacterized protein LOC128228428 isoform X1 [Mya arenaria]